MSMMYQFQPALALKAKKALDVPHASLAVFPTLSPDMSAANPGSLLIPSLHQRLLTGTFPGDGEKVMRLAQNSKRLKEILDIVLKGVEGAQAAWKEALKQGELWKDEMEECVAAAGGRPFRTFKEQADVVGKRRKVQDTQSFTLCS
jgi:hypothetical protein